MLIDTSDNVLTLIRPRSFAGLMTLYETNYIRLRQLVGAPAQLHDHLRSEVAGEPPLSIDVSERARYTSTIVMTYWFAESDGRIVADPNLKVRLYHDARMAEVLSWRNGSRHQLLQRFRHAGQSEIHPHWTVNMMLHKWLEYCLEQRHFNNR